MNSHPYLRAYMAGIVVPTIALVIIVTAFCNQARYLWLLWLRQHIVMPHLMPVAI